MYHLRTAPSALYIVHQGFDHTDTMSQGAPAAPDRAQPSPGQRLRFSGEYFFKVQDAVPRFSLSFFFNYYVRHFIIYIMYMFLYMYGLA